MTRSAWLESHDLFEGVGAHELNPRYSHVDGGDWDQALADLTELPTPAILPALFAVHRVASLTAVPIRLDGPDVSHHNYDAGPLNWDQVAAAPCTFGATKLTQSISYLDPTAAHSRVEMTRVGLRHRGLYHWLSSTTDVTAQAHWYLTHLDGGLQPGEYAMLDAEEAGITQAKCLQWCRLVEQATHRPVVVYTGAYVAGGTIWQNTELRTSLFGSRPFILAAYTTEARARALPGVAAYPWQAWQFSSNGPVPGVTGRCDMNRRDDDQAFDLASGVTLQPPTEDDMPQVITNDEPAAYQGVTYPRGVIKYVLDRPNVGSEVASKRHLGGAEHAAYGSPTGTYLNNAQLNDLPDFVATVAGGTVDAVARTGLSALQGTVASLDAELGRTVDSLDSTKLHLREAGT